MAKISLTYPDTGLTISIVVKNRDTGTTDFSGTMTEVGTTKVYKYDYAEAYNTDYVYTATVSGYSTMSGTIYRIGGGLTKEEHDRLYTIGGGASVSYEIRPKWVKEELKGLKEELLKELQKEEPIEKIDLSPIFNKIDNIERIDYKIEKETLKKVEKIEKWIENEQQKEEDEKLQEEIERMKKEEHEKQEQEDILNAINKIETKIKEQKDIQKEIDKQEIKNILKLLK